MNKSNSRSSGVALQGWAHLQFTTICHIKSALKCIYEMNCSKIRENFSTGKGGP